MSDVFFTKVDNTLPLGSWVPISGERTARFLKTKAEGDSGLTADVLKTVTAEAQQILSYCISPKVESGRTAVLVVGYVQSGKTLSFTTVSALARDNGFGVVVLLAGTTNNLKTQSEERLEEDLGLGDLQRDWRHFDNPNDKSPATFQELKKTLDNWKRRRDNLTQEDKPALLITVLKHSQRLQEAGQLLSAIGMSDVPSLIIDDESDQAGLNTKARANVLKGLDDSSGTYEAIGALRNALPHHSYLQYTATPQANLLLTATDVLNPAFAKVISSGPGYTGGRYFFKDRVDELILTIPDAEIFDDKHPFEEPPATLQNALRLYLLGISAGAGSTTLANRSMMAQVHQGTVPHATYEKWIRRLLADWSTAISSGGDFVLEEIRTEFRPAWDELRKTVADLPPLDELLQILPERANEIRVVIVNSTKDALKIIKWKSWPYWILVGGLKLDRGFTVEGLTITYMPRKVSENADVLQQRARFFGYRAKYADFCRVFLPLQTKEAFVGYVDDEEFFRSSLSEHEGKPMADWRRDFIVHKQLTRPTRANVMGRSVRRIPLKEGWTWPKSMGSSDEAIAANKLLFEAFAEFLRLHYRGVDGNDLSGVVDRRKTESRHIVFENVDLSKCLEFLMDLHLSSQEDSLLSTAIELAFGRLVGETPSARMNVVLMSSLKTDEQTGRSLSVLRQNIHAGSSPKSPATDAELLYSGDRSFAREQVPTLQLRFVKVDDGFTAPGGELPIVPWYAIHLPTSVANDAWLEND